MNDELVVLMGKRDSVENLEVNAINVTRGVAAGTIQRLLWQNLKHLSAVSAAIDSLVSDPHPAVRVAAIGVCIPILNIDRDKAVSWYLQACSHNDDSVLACRDSRRFLGYAVRTHFPDCQSILIRMAKSQVSEVQKWGSAHIAAVSLIHKRMRRQLKRCAVGTDHQRMGVGMAARDLVGDERYSNRCHSLLISFFTDSDETVRYEASRMFHEEGIPNTDNVRKLLLAYVSTSAFRDKPSVLLRALDSFAGSLLPISKVIFKICDVFAGPLAEASRDISTSVGGDGHYIAPLLLRLYGEAKGAADTHIQDRCLDSWDLLLENRVGSVGEVMETLSE